MLRPQRKRKGIANAMTAAALFGTSLLIFVALVDAKREYIPPEECGLYLAPSTIPGAGLGMYAGSTRFEEGSLVSDSDIMVPQWDMDYHNGEDDYFHLWDEYTWSASQFDDMIDDTDNEASISIISSGFGAAINCMMPLVNVADESWDGDQAFKLTRSGVLSDSPGMGAFTPMNGRRFEARSTIEPYSELYTSYGEAYFTGRSIYDFVPFRRHYRKADQIIKAFIGNVTLWQAKDRTEGRQLNSQTFEQELWDFIVQLRNVWDKSRVMFALPSKNSTTIEDLIQLLDFGGSKLQGYNDTVKDQEWMDEHGQCVDNIRNGKSEIPHAAKGAIANRFIPEGGLVSPAPLIHLPNRTSLVIYNHRISPEGKWIRDVTSPSTHQLLLNYCFGHKESTILLCPYGHLNLLINHNHQNPNSKIVWSEKKHLRHPEWFDQPISEWGKKFHSGLAMDFVAMRDIKEGEEITIDYGIEWENAWQEHVENFDSVRVGYRPSYELNEIADLRIPTIFEPYENQFHKVITFCRDYYFPNDHNFTPYKFDTAEDEDETVDWHYACRVLMRHDDDNYTVEIYNRERWRGEFDVFESISVIPEGILFNVPREAMFFRDIPYTRDHHAPWSFRHDMRIPDEIFPDIWKNLKAKDASKA